MPYYREQLLSAWTSGQIYEVGAPPAKIDPLLLKHARPNDIGVWAPNPRTTRRNQATRTRTSETNGASIAPPKFLSERAKTSEGEPPAESTDALQEALTRTALDATIKSEVPAMYRNVEIKYSRFGVDDFDFE